MLNNALLALSAVDAAKRDAYLAALMTPPNKSWFAIVGQASQNPEVLKQQEIIKSIQNVLQVGCLVETNPWWEWLLFRLVALFVARMLCTTGGGDGMSRAI